MCEDTPMPPHIQILTTGGAVPAPIAISISAGEESAISTLEIWNDKDDDFVDTTTAQNQFLKMLASSSGGPYLSTGVPLLDELWTRVRITHQLSAAGAVAYDSGTLAVGTNSEFPLPDLAPQTGVRFEFSVFAPAGSTADAVKIKPQVVGNQGSSPLSRYVGLATGSGVVPGDRVAGLRSLLRGFAITANDTAVVVVGRGILSYDGATVAHISGSVTFTLADGAAVNLGAAEDYLVTVSVTSAGVIVATRGLKAEEVTPPAVPSGNVLVGYLNVESADGIAVTVSQASIDQSGATYSEFLVTDGGGLSVSVAAGEGISEAGFRQPTSHATPVSVAASETSRIWRLANGAKSATLTDAPPAVGADLLALATTDTDSVTAIVDARRLVHRALGMSHIELVFRGVMTAVTPGDTLAMAIARDDWEIESVELDLSDVDAGWTGGALKANVLILAPGAPAPWPVGTAGGVTLFTSFATDDARPSIAFDATVLRAVSEDHEVRRIVRGTRLLLALAATVAGPGAEPQQEIRVALRVRRYR